MKFTHEWIEKNPWLLIGLILVVVSFGGLVEIVPLFFQHSTTEPVAGLKPYSPLRLAGRPAPDDAADAVPVGLQTDPVPMLAGQPRADRGGKPPGSAPSTDRRP